MLGYAGLNAITANTVGRRTQFTHSNLTYRILQLKNSLAFPVLKLKLPVELGGHLHTLSCTLCTELTELKYIAAAIQTARHRGEGPCTQKEKCPPIWVIIAPVH